MNVDIIDVVRCHHSAATRPLPSHFLQRGGKILRPGFTGCINTAKPVPLQAGHLCSDEFEGFIVILCSQPHLRAASFNLEIQFSLAPRLGLRNGYLIGLEPRRNSPRVEFMVLHVMAKSNKVVPKKTRGRPATARDPVTAIRLSKELRETVDRWSTKQGDQPGRSEAV